MQCEQQRPGKAWVGVAATALRPLGSLALCILVVLSSSDAVGGNVPGPEAEGVRNVALLRMELPRGFGAAEKRALEQDLLDALHRTGRFRIVDRRDMEEILEELRFQATDLVDQDEVVELGRLAGVDVFLACEIQPVQGVYQIAARLISVETGKVERIVVQRCEGRFDFLVAMFNEVAYDLAGEEAAKGWVRIETEPPEAEVSLFGVPRGLSPLELRLAPGLYLFSVARRGYTERRRTLEVVSSKETSWKVKLVKKRQFRLRDYIRGGALWERD